MKKCSKCNIEVIEENFPKTGTYCKKCQKEYSKNYRKLNEEKLKEQRKNYRENSTEYKMKYGKGSIYQKEYFIKNSIQWKVYGKKYRNAHPDKVKEKRQREKEKMRFYMATYNRERRKNDLDYNLRTVLTSRLRSALKSNHKTGSAVKDLGCTIQHLKLHLALFWDEGMTWGNYGNKIGCWSIDHIVPLASFDLTKAEQLKKAVHFSNLQPLWHIHNMSKGCKLEYETN